jgi:hypothetical protein
LEVHDSNTDAILWASESSRLYTSQLIWSDSPAQNTLWSPQQTHYLRLQPDGSLVIRSTSDSTVVWSTSAGPPADRYFLIMQGDSYLRVYTATSTGTDGMAIVWSSGASHTLLRAWFLRS